MANTDSYVSLSEAATLLGVSKATLRNWDKAGKLSAARHPLNSYRMYSLSELKQLQQQIALPLVTAPVNSSTSEVLDMRAVRRTVSRLHDVLRDCDSQSNIIGRFDEITKLIFAKVMADRTASGSPFAKEEADTPRQIRSYYSSLATKHSGLIPPRFRKLECSDAAISQSASVLRPFDFGLAKFDFKGLAYEEVIRNTFDKGDHQQFFTPPHVVEFMVELCKPYIKGSVCDPAAGTGGFLASVARHGFSYGSLTALEIDERLSWVAGINMFLHDAKNARSLVFPIGGTLGKEALPLFGRFDTILTNPPFGSDFTDRAALDQMELGSGRSSRRRGILFVERCHRLLRDEGTLAIILDEGVLNLSHAVDVRRFITRNFDLKAVISLPETAFMPYATVNSSILILRKRDGTANNRAVFYAKAETVGRKPNGDDDVRYDRDGKGYLDSDLPPILSAWHDHLRDHTNQKPSLAYVADVAEHLRSDANGHRIDFQYHHPARIESEKVLKACPFPVVRLSEICVERNSTIAPSQELPDAIIRYTGLAHIESRTGVAQQIPTPTNSIKSGVKRYEPGDIVFAKMRPNLRKVALMDFEEPGYVSPECAVLVVRPSEDGRPILDPLLLSILLRSDLVYGQLMHLIAGIGRPRISSSEMREVLIPLLPANLQAEIRIEYLRRRQKAGELRGHAAKLNAQAHDLDITSTEHVAAAFAGGRFDSEQN